MYNRVQAVKIAMKSICKHKMEVLIFIAFVSISDNIRIRFVREKEQKVFEEICIKQEKIVQKQNAEINVLKAEAEQAKEANKMVNLLEQIVKKITEEGFSE